MLIPFLFDNLKMHNKKYKSLFSINNVNKIIEISLNKTTMTLSLTMAMIY